MKLATATIETPLGRYALVASESGLVQAKPAGAAAPVSGAASAGAERMVARARAAFERYFAGAADAFASLPVDPQGSEFQRRVWRALREIPLGATASYGEIARKVGSPAAARAVGDANRRNPIAIAIPCHRVIGGDGSLVGYAGGLERKRWLLAHEATCAGAYAASLNGPEGQLPVALARRRISAAASI
jgi:methylated-DNA-[protein]-cysteine S-methyltransferase